MPPLLLRRQWIKNFGERSRFRITDADQFMNYINRVTEDLPANNTGRILRDSDIKNDIVLQFSRLNDDGHIVLKMAFGAVWAESEIHTSLIPSDDLSRAGLVSYDYRY